jgi:DNA-binding NarL/FixJ family response regulator
MTPHVLVVDDDQLFAQWLVEALTQDGRVAVVGRAENGREAVELALWLGPDVVLMDVAMPVMDGLDATRILRRALPSTPVVLISSSASDEDRRRAGEVGAHALLPKLVGARAIAEAALDAANAAVAR